MVDAISAGGPNLISFADFKARSEEWKKKARQQPPANRTPAFYMHAALELAVVDHPTNTLLNALCGNATQDQIDAAAIFDFIHGFSSLGYFLTATRCARLLTAPKKTMPIHPMGRIRLSEDLLEEPAVAPPLSHAKSDLDAPFDLLGRNVKAIFERDDDVTLETPAEVAASALPHITAGSLPLYDCLQAVHQCEEVECNLQEAELVRAAAAVAAMRLNFSLLSAAQTLCRAGEENLSRPLYLLASKLVELCHYTFGERLAAMFEALEPLPREPQTLESDRLRLESDYYITRQALGFEDGVWFLLPTKEVGPSWAYLSKCGSLIQAAGGSIDNYFDGEVWHRFSDPSADCKLPDGFGPETRANGHFALI